MTHAGFWGGGDVTAQQGSSNANQYPTVNKILNGTQVATPATLYSILTYTVPVAKKFSLLSIQCSSNGDAEWFLYINSVLSNHKRNWLNSQTIELDFEYPYLLAAGDVLEIKAKNNSKFGTTNDIDVFLYANEDNA